MINSPHWGNTTLEVQEGNQELRWKLTVYNSGHVSQFILLHQLTYSWNIGQVTTFKNQGGFLKDPHQFIGKEVCVKLEVTQKPRPQPDDVKVTFFDGSESVIAKFSKVGGYLNRSVKFWSKLEKTNGDEEQCPDPNPVPPGQCCPKNVLDSYYFNTSFHQVYVKGNITFHTPNYGSESSNVINLELNTLQSSKIMKLSFKLTVPNWTPEKKQYQVAGGFSMEGLRKLERHMNFVLTSAFIKPPGGSRLMILLRERRLNVTVGVVGTCQVVRNLEESEGEAQYTGY